VEADKHEYLALQNKLEARRIAREIKTAHDTLEALRAEQATTSLTSATTNRPSSGDGKAKKGKDSGSEKELKKGYINPELVLI